MTTNVYWYISKAKLDTLKKSLKKKFLSEKLSLTLKTPFIEAGASAQVNNESLMQDLEKVIKTISLKMSPPMFPEFLGAEPPSIFFFRGKAVRMISEGKYWLALENKTTALLLAGSSSHAIGAHSESSTGLSPTLDPVGAVYNAFRKLGETPKLAESLSYAWQEIMRPFVESEGTLPIVQGHAIFAATFEVHKPQMRRIGRDYLRRIVIGSPIYIQQVQS
jgi:hypothetical protein